MPNMANITVKSKANTDVVYVAKVSSAGDKSPARWSADALSPIVGFRPVFEAATRDNGDKSGRRLDLSYKFPVTRTQDGITSQTSVVPMSASVLLPTTVDGAIPDDAFVQFGNLMVSALIREVAATGYAPT